ncbi:MAG TPA: DUF305 domain-containing protein [Thermomicrobiales bacterium]|nr:DUF305 domain-containing protein [Thermomicrobiales bacterium]
MMNNRVERVACVVLLALSMMLIGGAGMSSARQGTPAASTPVSDPCSGPMMGTPGADQSEPSTGELEIIAPFDLAYLDAMITHVEGSASLAEVAAIRAEHDILRAAAPALADSLQDEADLLRSLRDQWYPGAPQVPLLQTVALLDEALAGMGADADSGMGVSSPLGAEEDARVLCAMAIFFDQTFLDLMTQRYYGDIGLAELALGRAEHPELRVIARDILARRQADLLQFATWSAEWEAKSGTPEAS